MIAIHDRADMAHALTLDLDPQLKELLADRIAGLPDELIDYTSIVVVEPGDTEADLVRECGFSPLVEPFDGARFGAPGFHAWWDHLQWDRAFAAMTITYGSAYACLLLIQDAEGTLPELLDLCWTYG